MSGNPQRRKFIRIMLGIAVLGYAGGLTSAVQKTIGIGRVSLRGSLRYEKFAALLGETFAVSSLDTKLGYRGRLQLVEAKKVVSSAQTEQFSLVFMGAAGDALAQDTYQMRHPTAGKANIFLQPFCSNGCSNYYQACFNLLS
ncbi:DUF6916 family protein [Methylomagnum sp.]